LAAETLFLEELRQEVSVPDKVAGLLAGYVLPAWAIERLLLRSGRADMDDLITVIFSSGSTGEPKGVMLSHHNVLSNAEAAIQVIDPRPDDRLVGILPLFHSFGFLIDLWVPFLVGCAAAYHFNPLEAALVGRMAKDYRGTLLLATPTFLRNYIRRVPAENFRHLRLVITGAEKLPRDVVRAFKEKFGVEPLEGYGCTEVAPVVAVNTDDYPAAETPQIGNKPGTVGHPIPGVAAKIVHPETGDELPLGDEGLLLVKGPNVMIGYLNRPELTAKVIRDGWYLTGDIASLDEDGFITITDRLERFSKIAGEMVPHIKVEQAIHSLLGTEEQMAVVVGVPDKTKGEKLLVLHRPMPIDIEELWQRLQQTGLPKLWIPARDSFFPVDDFPYLGSGKVDLKSVKRMALELVKSRGSREG